ncbi:MAG TPA: extracellular solute-binding protein [Clostridia bacterium]|nr:extracellular solute-binding protein [Clostridia bacterium]
MFLGLVLFLSPLLAYWMAVRYPDRALTIFPNFKYHPLRIHYERERLRVNPLVQFDPQRLYTLELWDVRWPIFWHEYFQYEEFLVYTLEGFFERHPNVSVHITLFSPEDYLTALRTALSEGNLPDVYVGPILPELLESGRVIAVDAFLTPEDRALYDTRTLDVISSKRGVIGFPRTIGVYGWLANAEIMKRVGMNPDITVSDGWTWNDFHTFAGKVKEAGLTPLALDNFRGGVTAVKHLCMQTDEGLGEDLYTENGEHPSLPRLTEAGLGTTLEFLDGLRKAGYLPDPVKNMYKRMIPGFWNGQIAVIGPCGPGMTRHVLERMERLGAGKEGGAPAAKGSTNVTPVLVPIPARRLGDARTPFEVTVAVPLDPGGQSDKAPPDLGHARLAVELARFLSQADVAWVAYKLGEIPAYLPERQRWEALVPSWLLHSMKALLGRVIPPEEGPPGVMGQALTEEALRDQMEPILEEFWEGGVGSAQREQTP